jgi:hypothetical protein
MRHAADLVCPVHKPLACLSPCARTPNMPVAWSKWLSAGQNSQPKNELRVTCQSNLASCFLQLERWQECVDMCDTVLSSDSKNRKALFRRGGSGRLGCLLIG